jgi:hypothetical protein
MYYKVQAMPIICLAPALTPLDTEMKQSIFYFPIYSKALKAGK